MLFIPVFIQPFIHSISFNHQTQSNKRHYSLAIVMHSHMTSHSLVFYQVLSSFAIDSLNPSFLLIPVNAYALCYHHLSFFRINLCVIAICNNKDNNWNVIDGWWWWNVTQLLFEPWTNEIQLLKYKMHFEFN